LTAAAAEELFSYRYRISVGVEICTMSERTCAACDCKLATDVISVKLGGKTVEVCCEECAASLREAHASKEDRNKA
jgi:hypothetical protein